MQENFIKNNIRLTTIKEQFANYLTNNEFLKTIFPEFIKEEDQIGLLHFIYHYDSTSNTDNKTQSTWMNGNLKKDKNGYTHSQKKALRFIATILADKNNVTAWVDFLRKNYPNINFQIIKNIISMDADLFPTEFRELLQLENDTYFLLLFLICWAIFGEQINDCKFKTSKEYLKADTQDSYPNDEAFIHSMLSDCSGLECIEMAYHSGYKWLYDTRRADLLANYLSSGGHLKVIVNRPDIADSVAKYIRSQNREYVGFSQCIEGWKKMVRKYPNQVEFVISDIPLLHSFLHFQYEEKEQSKMLVIFYTYGNSIMWNNHHLFLSPSSKEYSLFQKEFNDLWENRL